MDALTLSISPEVWGMIALTVAAVIKFIDLLFERDFRGAAKIVGAGLGGAIIAGLVPDVKVFIGALAGLSVSGLITVVSFARSTTTASVVTTPPDGEVV